jgi:hypothetical protein
MKALLTAVLIIGLIGIGNITFAQDKKVALDTISETIQEKTDMVANHEYKGIVTKTENGYTLTASAGEEVYLLQGEKLEDLVGQTVHISGKLLKGETGNTILIVKAEPTS